MDQVCPILSQLSIPVPDNTKVDPIIFNESGDTDFSPDGFALTSQHFVELH